MRKSIWAVFMLVLAGGSFWLGNYYRDYADQIGVPALPVSNSSTTEVPAVTAAATIPAPTPVAGVKVTAISPESITVQTAFNQTKSFTISNTTPVYSTVLTGQTGKSLLDMKVGDTVTVYPTKADPAKAGALAFTRDPSLALTAEEANNSVAGKVVAVNGSDVMVQPSAVNSAKVTVTIAAATKIITVVLAGQKGLGNTDMRVGTEVVAGGLITQNGKNIPKIVQIVLTQ